MIIEDTRQKKGKHDIKHSQFQKLGVDITRCKLPFGDYALPPSISVDTKENMHEIAQNIVNDHTRFRAECISASNAGCKLYILVENYDGIRNINDVHNWVNPDIEYRPKAVTGERLEKAMKTMNEKYGVRFMFCHPSESAEMILKILNGDYENERVIRGGN